MALSRRKEEALADVQLVKLIQVLITALFHDTSRDALWSMCVVRGVVHVDESWVGKEIWSTSLLGKPSSIQVADLEPNSED